MVLGVKAVRKCAVRHINTRTGYYAKFAISTKVNKFHSKKGGEYELYGCEEVTVKEGGPRMIVTGYSSVWLSVVGMTVTGSSGKLFMNRACSGGGESFCGRSLKGYHYTRPDHIRPGVPMPAMNDSRSYHATIIKLSLFCGTLSPG